MSDGTTAHLFFSLTCTYSKAKTFEFASDKVAEFVFSFGRRSELVTKVFSFFLLHLRSDHDRLHLVVLLEVDSLYL